MTSLRVRGIMGSDFAHRYAEGHPGERYYQGTEIIDEIESLLKQHMKALFRCKHTDVRPISGTIANDAVFSRYMQARRRGDGELHPRRRAHQPPQGRARWASTRSNIVNFPLTADGWHIDVEHTLDLIKALEPKVMIMGKSLFLFPEPVKEIAPYCEKRGIPLLYDGAHVLGLIAGHQFQDPLAEGASIVTGSTHKTFFGSQRGVILSNLDDAEWRKIDKGAFPGSSSNHHLETLVALACLDLRDAGVRRGVRAPDRGQREAPREEALRAGLQGAGGELRLHREPPGRRGHERASAAGMPPPGT